MRDKTSYIKLDRNILTWGWFKDTNTFKLFVYLLLVANVKDHEFLGVTIYRGELATSLKSLAIATGLTERNVRTALSHLKATGEVTVHRHPKFTVISIPRYDYYQNNRQAERQSTDSRATGDRQQYKNDIEGDRGKGARSAQGPARKSTYSLALELAREAEEELAAEGSEEDE